MGIIVCMIIIPILASNVCAEMDADFNIRGGYGVYVDMTNTGDEPLFDRIWCQLDGPNLQGRYAMSPGMREPLDPGETQSWRVRTPWIGLQWYTKGWSMPCISYCTFNVSFINNGGDQTLFFYKSVDVFYFFGFVKILS